MSTKGTSGFILQRASAVILLPLGAWVLFNIVAHVGADYSKAKAWLTSPFNSILLGSFVVVGAFHMRIGMGEVITDYIQGTMRDILSFLNWVFSLAVIVATLYSVYSLSFAG